jgi:hypothetical protein
LLAEDQSADYAPWPGSDLVHGPGFDVWFGPPYYPDLTVVRRVRLPPGGVDEGVRASRRLIEQRGRHEAVWSVGALAAPPGLIERLVALGMRPDSDPVLKAVALTLPPLGVPSEIGVRRVVSCDEFRSFFRIQQAAAGTDPQIVARGEAFLDDAYEADVAADHVATYLAWIDGEPVATARATFTDVGVVMNGGGTLHRARGRGCYRALVGAGWIDAVARGTAYLTTHAGQMAYPILKGMGFGDVCDVRMLVDSF